MVRVAFEEIVGQEKVARMLKNALRRRRLAHAYIFSGTDSDGKRKMAIELAKALNCSTYSDDACDNCTNCMRIANGNHPDVHWIAPDGTSVKIKQIRTLQKNIAYHSVEAMTKVFVIEAVETMTIQAANSLLKILEEPEGTALIILLTDNVQAIIPTIKSRCQLIPFQHPDPEIVCEQLIEEGVSREVAVIASRMANGLQEAREMCGETWFTSAPPLVVELTNATCDDSNKALIVVHEQLLKSETVRTHMELFLDLMILWYRDMLTMKLGCRQPQTFLEHVNDVKRQVMKWTESGIIQAVEKLLVAKQQLRQHVPPQLVLEGWVLSVQEG